MSADAGALTVGVDIGTTSVKAVAVDGDGTVVARARVPHGMRTTTPGRLEHDARRAWRDGPRRAWRQVTAALPRAPAGVCVASMVPSLTAVGPRGVPLLPGLLYGDERGQPRGPGPHPEPPIAGMPFDGEWFLRWAVEEAPGARGYWPCQSVATFALAGVPALDSAASASLGSLLHWGQWNTPLLDEIGVVPSQLPVIVPMCEAGGTLPGTDTVFAGGTVDALGDQIVSGAVTPGDVLAVFGATLVIWVVTEEWQVEGGEGLISIPHTVAGRGLQGGPSNAGALFVDWARGLTGMDERAARAEAARSGDPARVPVWLPYLRGERTPFNDRGLRAVALDLDITHDPAALRRGAYEASGFVIRRMVERAGVDGRRIVASGGGSRSAAWMAAVADASGLPVDSVAVSEGAALGAAYIARMAAGLASSLDDAAGWARVGSRHEPDPAWAAAAEARYQRFAALGPGV